MFSALTQTELFALLTAGQTVVVPHAHAARTLRTRYARHLAGPHAPITNTGSLLAWPEWTTSLWSTLLLHGVESRVLLNRAQEEGLWADIMAQKPAEVRTPHPRSARAYAQLARSGLRLAAAYNAGDRLRSAAESFDARTFATWLDAFREVCTRWHLLAPAFLEQTLARHLRTAALQAPPSLHLVGFEQHTPAQRDLLSALESAGISLQSHRLACASQSADPALAITAADVHEQLHFAVRWIAKTAKDRPGSFALITPRAEMHRPALERLFRQYLAPELEPVSADLSSTPWLFTAQPPLAAATLIAHALHLLRWMAEPLPLEHISALLLSPYFSSSDAPESRARFEAQVLRQTRQLRPELDLTQFRDLVQAQVRNPDATRFPELLALVKFLEQKGQRPAARSYADWADFVRSALLTAGWPGPRTLTADEFSTTEAWDGLLDLLSTLDIDGRRLPFAAFLQQLEAEAGQMAQKASLGDAPVQVISLAEAEAIPFDHVLLLDATDTGLPTPESSHPLLARRLQNALEMPGSDPARTYRRTRAALQQLATRCGSLHLVAPATDATGPLRPSRLAGELDFVPVPASALLPSDVSPAPVALVPTSDAVALPPLPSPLVHGGARVLELQAGCGFRAFAELRLRAEPPHAPTLGLGPREAGNRLHAALDELWHNLKDQASLRAMPSADRRVAARQAAKAALRPLLSHPDANRPWSRALLDVLEDRFSRLLLHWLELEEKRGPFKTVQQEEQRHIHVGPLELKVRPDRVDEVNGGLVYIDYKSASALSTDYWLGERPDAPQLPLYTLLAEAGTVRGLAFGRVRPGKDMAWISLADTPGIFPDTKKSNHDLAAEILFWQAELARLAQAFADGDARVNPKSYPKTCQYCANRLLCRLDPNELLAQDTADEDSMEDDLHG